MRPINYIVIGCTGLPNPDQDLTMLRALDREPHVLVRADGTVEMGRPLEDPGRGERGHNWDGIFVRLAGRRNFHVDQLQSLEGLARALHDQFPDARLVAEWEIEGDAPRPLQPAFSILWLKSRWAVWARQGRLQ